MIERHGFSNLDKLTQRERRVLEALILVDNPMPLDDLAEELGLARARLRQLEALVRKKVGLDQSEK